MTKEKPEVPRLFESLRDLLGLLADDADPGDLVRPLLERAIALVGAARGFVVLVGPPPAHALEIAAAMNLEQQEIEDPQFQISRSIVKRVALGGEAELISDAAADLRTRDFASVKDLDLHSVVCVPLRAHGKPIGALYVDHPQLIRRFGESELATLQAFGVPASIILDSARRLNELVNRVEAIEKLRADLAEHYRRQSLEANQLRALVAPVAPAAPAAELPGIVARSAAMKRVLELVRKVGPSEAPVLIVGESGTGKESVARALHAVSRRTGPFVAENCAALADPLLENELFGHEEGAFTGALRGGRAGLFEAAHQGTLLLDEVGEMSPSLQSKLLRVLQEREVRRVGGVTATPIDVRVVAATHRDLATMVSEGRFRSDLYYRLNVVRIEIPPLRERPDDLAALLPFFLERASQGRTLKLEPQARELLLAHRWPGNVRELQNEVQRLAILAAEEGVIRPGLLSPAIVGRPERAPAEKTDGDPPIDGVWQLEPLEREMILRALRHAGGNKTLAAKLLGIAKSSLYSRLEKHGLS